MMSRDHPGISVSQKKKRQKLLHHVISNFLIFAIHSPPWVIRFKDLGSAVFIILSHASLSNQTLRDFLFVEMKFLLNPSSNRPLSDRLMTAPVVRDKRAQIQAAVYALHPPPTHTEKNNQTNELSWEWTVRARRSVTQTTLAPGLKQEVESRKWCNTETNKVQLQPLCCNFCV